MKKYLIPLAILMMFPLQIWAGNWTYITPIGITVKVDKKAIPQYEQRWGPWSQVNWDRLDEWFGAYSAHYGVAANPRRLTIKIEPWQFCDKKNPTTPHIRSPLGQCVQGWYYGGKIGVSLGYDSESDDYAFCPPSPFGHELSHFMLYMKRDPCKNLGEYNDPGCERMGLGSHPAVCP